MRSVFVDSLARQFGCEKLHGKSYVLLEERWATDMSDLYCAEAICEEDGPCIDDDLYPVYVLSYNGMNCISSMRCAVISDKEIIEEAEKAYKNPTTAMIG